MLVYVLPFISVYSVPISIPFILSTFRGVCHLFNERIKAMLYYMLSLQMIYRRQSSTDCVHMVSNSI